MPLVTRSKKVSTKFWTEFSADPARPSAAARRREQIVGWQDTRDHAGRWPTRLPWCRSPDLWHSPCPSGQRRFGLRSISFPCLAPFPKNLGFSKKTLKIVGIAVIHLDSFSELSAAYTVGAPEMRNGQKTLLSVRLESSGIDRISCDSKEAA